MIYRMELFTIAVKLTRSWPVQHEVTTVELQYLCVSSIYVVRSVEDRSFLTAILGVQLWSLHRLQQVL